MKQRQINVFGKTNESGQLQLQPEAKAFLQSWPNARIVAKFSILPDEPSEALKGYYFHYIVPTMKAALWESGQRMNEKECEEWLRRYSPITFTIEYKNGKWNDIMKEIAELSNAELSEHVEYWKQIAAENYSVYIEEPQTILNKNNLNFNE